jgi:hypothetical protein
VGTIVSGHLGPGHSKWVAVDRSFRDGIWNDDMAWVDTVNFTSSHEQPLFVSVAWTPDGEGLSGPQMTFVDDAGKPVALTPLLKQDHGQQARTGVFTTKEPHHGALHVSISSSSLRLTSGSYSVCVAPDEQTCDKATPSQRLLSL